MTNSDDLNLKANVWTKIAEIETRYDMFDDFDHDDRFDMDFGGDDYGF